MSTLHIDLLTPTLGPGLRLGWGGSCAGSRGLAWGRECPEVGGVEGLTALAPQRGGQEAG